MGQERRKEKINKKTSDGVKICGELDVDVHFP